MKALELHIVSENDELSLRNGSAILRVCRELQRAAASPRHGVLIGGSFGKLVDLPDSVELLIPRRGNRFSRLLDRASKYAFGVPWLQPRVSDKALPDRPEYVYCHNQPWIYGEVRRAFPNARTSLYVHNQILLGAPKATIRKVLRRWDSIICVSNFIKDDLLRRAGFGTNELDQVSKFVTVLNGVDSTLFGDPHIAPTLDVTFVGRVIPEKGLDTLVNAMKLVAHTNPGVKLTIVGGHSFLPSDSSTAYELLIHSLATDDHLIVESTGPLPPNQVPALMDSSKIVVVPSRWNEPCALVFLEALASNAALVACSVGGLPELGGPGGAVFVPSDNPESMADAIRLLLNDDDLRDTRVRAGKSWARDRDWGAVYAEIVSERERHIRHQTSDSTRVDS